MIKRPLPIGKNKKVELGVKIMIEFVGSYVFALMFENYADCLCNDKIILKSQQRFENDYHNVCTKQINKIALSSNDDKRLQIFDKIITYPYGKNAFKVCESKALSRYK